MLSTMSVKNKKVAILQSNYIPWKGYFDLIAYVDEFIFYDLAQFTKNDWRNRNQIKTSNGLKWLSIPVKMKGHLNRSIKETEIIQNGWQKKHWQSLLHSYSKAPYFSEIAGWLEPMYMESEQKYLSALNRDFIKKICEYLNIKTTISNVWDYKLMGGKSEKLVHLCQQCQATTYVSGPSAKDYLETNLFEKADIQVEWFEYANYPEYKQFHGEFNHHVSILDLLFHCGPNSAQYMKHIKKRQL